MTAVLATDADRFPVDDEDRALVAGGGLELRELAGHDPDEVVEAARGAAAILVYYARFPSDVIARLDGVRVLARCGTGYDAIDVPAARARGIEVVYVPGYGVDDVADHALALLLACARKLALCDRAVRAGAWPSYADLAPLHRLRGRTLGLVGYGRIARNLAAKARALGLEVLAHDPYVAEADASLDDVLARSHLVSVHVPLSDATRGLIGAAELARMRPGAILVNTARGPIVDGVALAAALRSGHLAGAGVDVFEEAPLPADHPLRACETAVLTPHSAAYGEEALAEVRKRPLADALRVLRGETPRPGARVIDDLYRTMRTIRRFEERVVVLVNANEIAGVTHEYVGQEAVATGVCAALRRDDVITSTHRGHGHLIAKGAEPRGMFAELLGRVDGLNRGRGGSMHIADLGVGVLGANGMVAAGAPHAAGAAWAFLQDASGRYAASFFGEGGVNQGVLLETMNLAAIWKLPLLFVCENNGYAVTMSFARATAGDVVERARAFGLAAESVDGMDVEAVLDAARRARSRPGPTFLECRTYRFVGHHTAERTMKLAYRSDEEIASWRARDPLDVAGARMDAVVRAHIDAEVEAALDQALDQARTSPRPDPAEALDLMYASGPRPRAGVAP